ncbi:MAG: amino acid permease [Myxococcales bacterium]|nr:amino acid permease [Myxococcales bacterium]
MTSEPDRWGERLPRRLGLWSTVAVLVGSTIGSGIFRTPAVVAERVPDLGLFALAWVLGGVVALAGALTLAELAAAMPRTGGIYVYIREAFGRLPAFLFGWCELMILRPSAYGALAITSSEYLWRLVGADGAALLAPLPLSRAQLTAAAMLIVVAIVNIRGVRLGALVQNVSTVIKVAAILAIIVLGVALVPTAPELAAPAGAGAGAGTSAATFGLAMVSILWAYDGWSDAGFVSGEVRDPQRALPRSFILGTLAVVVLYLAVNAVYASVIPIAEMPGSPLIAADVATRLIGPVGATLVAAAVMVSTFGTLNGTMMTGPRVFYAMAEDGLFFRRIAAIHPVYGTPSAAIILSVLLGVVFVASRSFAELADGFVVGIWPFYALAVAAVFVLRRRRPELERPYRVVGYPVVPLLFLVASIYLLGSYAVTTPWTFAVNVAVIAAGAPIYALWLRRQG